MKRKNPGRHISVPAGIALGTIASTATALAGGLALAIMVSKETVAVGGIGIGAAIIWIIAAAAGALVATALTKRRKLLVAGLTALAFFFVLLGITIFFFDGAFGGLGKATLMILLGTCASLLPEITKKPRKNKIKIPAYR